jgi:hypothetical protein
MTSMTPAVCSVQLPTVFTLACVDLLTLSLLQSSGKLYSWAQPALLCWLSHSRPAGLLAEPRRGHMEAAAAGPADVSILAGSAPMRSFLRVAAARCTLPSSAVSGGGHARQQNPCIHPLVKDITMRRVSSLHSDGVCILGARSSISAPR